MKIILIICLLCLPVLSSAVYEECIPFVMPWALYPGNAYSGPSGTSCPSPVISGPLNMWLDVVPGSYQFYYSVPFDAPNDVTYAVSGSTLPDNYCQKGGAICDRVFYKKLTSGEEHLGCFGTGNFYRYVYIYNRYELNSCLDSINAACADMPQCTDPAKCRNYQTCDCVPRKKAICFSDCPTGYKYNLDTDKCEKIGAMDEGNHINARIQGRNYRQTLRGSGGYEKHN